MSNFHPFTISLETQVFFKSFLSIYKSLLGLGFSQKKQAQLVLTIYYLAHNMYKKD